MVGLVINTFNIYYKKIMFRINLFRTKKERKQSNRLRKLILDPKPLITRRIIKLPDEHPTLLTKANLKFHADLKISINNAKFT